jgi:acyl-CoA synthetase (AMP-forming)/AMP-acid ligase II
MTMDPLTFVPTIPNLIKEAASRHGDREFIVTPDRRLSYAATDNQSRRLAKRLLKAGIGKGARVGMLFPQGPDFMVAFAAIARIGAIAVPLSTFLRPPEMRRACRHADIAVLLVPPVLLGRDMPEFLETVWPDLKAATHGQLFLHDAPYLRAVWLCGRTKGTDRSWAIVAPEIRAIEDDADVTDDLLREVESEVKPSDLAVLVSTSGATAEPKGVVHTHGAQVRHSWNLSQLYGLTVDAKTFTSMPFFWIAGLTVSLLNHMHVGATLITAERIDGPVIVDTIEREGVNRVVGWTLVEQLTGDPALADRDLRWLVALQRASITNPGRRHNSLGMSETSGPHTVAPADMADIPLSDDHFGSFGPPVPGVQHKIVDPVERTVLPDGVEGEICVRGYSVMDGLYKKERSETFDEDGWYPTGDKGSFRDGLLFFTGRLGEMIKTRGANVAPREVELVMQSLPGVKAAFVVGLPGPSEDQQVACMVCPEPGVDIDPAVLTSQLRELLSSFKVPRKVVIVPYEEAPWLPSGKISKPRVVEILKEATV